MSTLLQATRPTFNVHEAVVSAVSHNPHRLAVTRLVTCCHRFGMAYLYAKARRRGIPDHLTGLSIDDLALDCIAEIFQRDEAGSFSVLQTYFQQHDFSDLTEEELLVMLRRLVFSKVNESLFRLYRETDPNLAKIIRNVKDAAKAMPHFQLLRHNKQQWLVVRHREHANGSSGDELAALTARPVAPQEILTSFFIAHIGPSTTYVRELTKLFSAFVQTHPHYASAYPVTGFAQALRVAFLHVGETEEAPQEEPAFYTFEVTEAIRLATDHLEATKRSKYVGRGKVSAPVFAAYIAAIRDILAAQHRDDLEVESYYVTLNQYLPDMSEDEYRDIHRNILEYLVKLARAQFFLYFKDKP